mmetsp:Transcript_3954/g.8681  ORF Transcript_3954/g.8681 Transcript_3954/m.8681 type:complete len:206 (+) Transcript_3954:1071-1688(+)
MSESLVHVSKHNKRHAPAFCSCVFEAIAQIGISKVSAGLLAKVFPAYGAHIFAETRRPVVRKQDNGGTCGRGINSFLHQMERVFYGRDAEIVPEETGIFPVRPSPGKRPAANGHQRRLPISWIDQSTGGVGRVYIAGDSKLFHDTVFFRPIIWATLLPVSARGVERIMIAENQRDWVFLLQFTNSLHNLDILIPKISHKQYRIWT